MEASEAREISIELIRAEMDQQLDKWGEQNHTDYIWLAILMEEVGEACKNTLEDKYPTEEIIQVAAVAASWLECKLRNKQ